MNAAEHTERAVEELDMKSVAERVAQNGGKPVTMQIYFLHGIFGELLGCDGVCEEVLDTDEKLARYGLDPKEGGTYLKILGCSYLYKGDPNEAKVYGVEQAKSMLSDIPRDVVGGSVLYSAAVALRFLLQRKKFWRDAHYYSSSIRWHTMRLHGMPEIRYSKWARELKRAMYAALCEEFRIPPVFDLVNGCDPWEVDDPKFHEAGAIAKLTAFTVLFMERDGAYRFPVQDMFGALKRENIDPRDRSGRSGAREMLRLLDLMIARNTNLTLMPGVSNRTEGVPQKFRFAKKVLRAAFLVSPRLRRIVQAFLLSMDPKVVGLDDADWYFCLRRNTHNYRGVPLPERLEELRRIDAEKGHRYVQLVYKKQDPEPKSIGTMVGEPESPAPHPAARKHP